MRVYEAIVRGLEGIGVQAAFGGAGENAAGLMLALKHSKRIRPVITRHEQAASSPPTRGRAAPSLSGRRCPPAGPPSSTPGSRDGRSRTTVLRPTE